MISAGKARSQARPRGIVIAEAASALTGEPLIAVATGVGRPSVNRKTGKMIQVYVLARDALPTTAAATHADSAVCGSCKHRPSSLGTCYVDLYRGPNQVWRAYVAGAYPRFTEEHRAWFANATVRVSAYGDCAAMPFAAWAPLLAVGRAAKATILGYTHLWRNCDPRFSRFCMASVETANERSEAKRLGYKTFRIRGQGHPLLNGEVQCPADSHADVRNLCGVAPGQMTCLECRICQAGGNGPDVTLVPHGLLYRSRRLERWLATRSEPSATAIGARGGPGP